MRLVRALALCLTFAPSALARQAWQEDMAAALQAAREKRSLVLVDFYAPWCYSCYYMDQHVLNQPEMKSLEGRLELVKLDVDSPEGARQKEAWRVRFLPTYVVVNAQGKEVGRILGEQSRADFFRQLQEILDKNSTLDDLETGLRQAGLFHAPAIARDVLQIHVRRKTAEEGLRFLDSLPAEVRRRLEADPESRREILRLRLSRAKEAKDAQGCLKTGRQLLALDLGCSLPYDAFDLNPCVEGLPMESRKAIYAVEWKSLQGLLEKRVFRPSEDRCADLRSPVELAAELAPLMGRKNDNTLERAIELMKSELGGDLGKDRNKADNLRAFLERAGRDTELDALYPGLIAAYPGDYVYSYRFGKHLLKRGKPKEALDHLDAAAAKAYGSNRLRISGERAKAMAQLGEIGGALKELERAIQDSPASFPEETAALMRLKSELAARRP